MRCWFIKLVLWKALRFCKIGFKRQQGRTDTTQRIMLHPTGCWEWASVQGAARTCRSHMWKDYHIKLLQDFLKTVNCVCCQTKRTFPWEHLLNSQLKARTHKWCYCHKELPTSSPVPMSLSCSQRVCTAQHRTTLSWRPPQPSPSACSG